ncbi:tetratricopeptide repeat protein [Hyphococcus sp. DH-69]|uniref:tetratricopeptide repeat protein n=1 Tax=Hyphococcus formosus TaxID=3143534 RepID=UPI00398AF46C
MRSTLVSILSFTVFIQTASAQMSVTTVGATEAMACYQDASNQFSSDTANCDAALERRDMTRADRKKTLVNRGVILNRAGQYQRARLDLDAAIALDETLAEAFLNRGNSYYLGLDYDNALSDYERALALSINKPWAAWYNIGLVYEATKKPAKAIEAYQNALDVNPNFTQAQKKLEKLR